MTVIPFPSNERKTVMESNGTSQGLELFLVHRRDTIQNLEYAMARLGEVQGDIAHAAAYRLIETTLAELKAMDTSGPTDEEDLPVLYQRLKDCEHALHQSFQLIRGSLRPEQQLSAR